MENIIIVGAGPAGIMSAISSARNSRGSKNIIILEKNPIIGKKILASGNGRCNISNAKIDLSKYHGDKNFLREVFSRFDNNKLISFFDELGVKLIEEEYGRIFPATKQAVTITDALLDELKWFGITVNCNEGVISIKKDKRGFLVQTTKANYNTDKVILSAGGCSHPQLGSTKKGFELAESFGHHIVEPYPALVPIELEGNWFHKLQGVKADVKIIIKNNSSKKEYNGEILFAKYGISGPVTLDASRSILDNCRNKNTEIFISFLPEFNAESLENHFNSIVKSRPQKKILELLSGIMPKKIAVVLISNIAERYIDKSITEIPKVHIRNIIELLLNLRVQVKGSRPFTESMVTAGGVSTDEVDPSTMQSKLVKNLCFAGEILNIDAESGGYNMQFAFSTGWIAGKN